MLVHINRWTGWFLLAVILLLTLMVGASRYFIPRIDQYHAEIERYLSEQLGAQVQIDRLQGGWSGSYPTLSIQGLSLTEPNTDTSRFRLDVAQIEAQVDLWDSLLARWPIFVNLQVDAAKVVLKQQQGRWIAAAPTAASQAPSTHTALQGLVAALSRQPQVRFNDAQLELYAENGQQQRFAPITVQLNNSRREHQLIGRVLVPQMGKDARIKWVVETQDLPRDPLQGDYRIYAKVERLGQQLLDLNVIELPFVIDELSADSELWARWRKGQLSYAHGRLAVNTLQFADSALQNLTDSGFDYWLQPTRDNQWQLVLSDVQLKEQTKTLNVPFLSIQARLQEGKIKPELVQLKQLALAPLSDWLSDRPYLPDDAQDALQRLQPSGTLENLHLRWRDPEQWLSFVAEGDLVDVSVKDYYGAPALSFVNGRLTLTAEGGSVDLNSPTQFGMSFPDLFTEGWHYQQATGHISWSIDQESDALGTIVTVNSGLINLQSSDLKAAGRFSMYLPLNRALQTELTLQIALKDADALQAPVYIPPAEVGESLHQWVAGAIKGGLIREGSLILRTPTRSLPDREPPSVQLFFDVAKADVAYEQGWPVAQDVDLLMSLNQGQLLIEAQQGRIQNSNIHALQIQLLEPDAPLRVNAKLQGDAADVLAVLRESPVKEAVAGLAEWDLSGRHETLLQLTLPLQAQQTLGIDVESRLTDGQFTHTGLLDFTALQGNFHYRSAAGLTATDLQGTFLGETVRGQIDSIAAQAGTPALSRISLVGKVDTAALKDALQWQSLSVAQGKAAAAVRVDVCRDADKGCAKVVIDSDLAGVALDLPEPFGKKAAQQGTFQLVGDLSIPQPVWRFNVQNQVRGVTKQMADGSRTRITLGGGRPEEPAQQGLWIDGQISRLNVADVAGFTRGGASEQGTKTALDLYPLSVDLLVDTLNAGDLSITDLNLSMQMQSPQQFVLQAQSPLLKGTLTPKAEAGRYGLAFDYLHLPGKDERDDTPQQPVTVDTTPSLDTKSWPELDLLIADLQYKGKALGTWQAEFRPDNQGQLSLHALQGKLAGFTLAGEAGWRVDSGRVNSYLNAEVKGNRVEQLLQALAYEKVLEADSGHVKTQFSWPGYPWDYSAATLGGVFKMALNKGRLIESGQSSNLLRVFGILNLNTIARRLSLNFNDLLQKGVAFDTIRADYLLNNGVAYAQSPLTLDGPSANIKLSGEIDVAKQAINSEMDVVLPLTSNVPIAAVLLGAPHIAGAAFLIDKLIGDKLERVSTLKYRLSGSLSDPDVKAVLPDSARKEGSSVLQGGDQ